MSVLLEGKTAVVTGAGAGIGRAIARAFAMQGAAVIVAEQNTESGQRVATELANLGPPGQFVPLDVTDMDSVRAAMQGVLEREDLDFLAVYLRGSCICVCGRACVCVCVRLFVLYGWWCPATHAYTGSK